MSPTSTKKPAILEAASVQQRQRLLELFPIANLREQWPDEEGSKEELSLSVGRKRGTDEIADFVAETFSCCKEHIYIFNNESDALSKLATVKLSDGEKIRETSAKDHAESLYLVRATFEIILREPLEATELTFLWPVRVEATKKHIMVRFIMLEKNVPTYFPGRPYNFGGKNVDEKSLLRDIETSLKTTLKATDLHKGIKGLWKAGKIDSSSAGFKKPRSTAFEAMDGEGLIKEDNPTLYKEIIALPLFKTVFLVTSDDWSSVSLFQVEPSKGIVSLLRYSERKEDVDSLVREILRLNQ